LNIEKEFCQYCGSHTLVKVSVFIKEDGTITYFRNPKRRANLRGTKYSIPKPVHGRGNKDLILREDDLLYGERRMLVKKLEKE
jgi:RNA-binding protein NOB1